ncbi:uncharacterized protein LOC133205578 [Saccostrea echinata]|uniref:uncharacterized protein LOC133205578 n=1 Tax=Saccostrea echinata TaxID=191078 RepID=UPI002A83D827|nr:uncharacterized protein LOC133205578 [Saccostrea echinata]
MLGYQFVMKGLVTCQAFLSIMMTMSSCYPTVHKRSISIENRETENWTGENIQGRTCLPFCLYINCNNGTCYQDPVTCGLRCICNAGYSGRRCKKEIQTTTLAPTTPDPKSKSEGDLVRILLGSIQGNIDQKDNASFLTETHVSGDDEDEFRTTLETPGDLVKNSTESVDLSSLNKSHKGTDEIFSGFNKPLFLFKLDKEDQNTMKINNSNTKISFRKNESTSNTPLSNSASNKTKKDDQLSESVSIAMNESKASVPSLPKPHNKQIDEEGPSLRMSSPDLELSVLEPFTSLYLDECDRNCSSENVCVPIKNRFHCYPKKHECPSGLPCENGICMKNGSLIKCLCEPGWIGDMCNRNCSLNCNGGACYRSSEDPDGATCICNQGYGGKRCEHKKELISAEEKNQWYWYVIIPCICCVIVLIIVLVIIIYCMQKRKWLFAMKIVHFFKEYEDDDGKEYDAFISYKSSKEDEDFVLHQLYPKLEEEMGFKLCLHFRDFTPGDIIANNIIQAIENSRRTIMVLSPNYVESEWCRMEYQKAQHEMLKRKHRIIPIMFRDITKCEKFDKALGDILRTVTYIQWPEDGDSNKIERFWNQLRLSLPKKRGPASSSSSSYTSSGSGSTVTTDIYSSVSKPLPSSSIISSDMKTNSDTILNITENESAVHNNAYPSYISLNEQTSSPQSPNTISSLPNETVQNSTGTDSQPDNSSSRLRKIVKDMLKLKIHSRSFSARLQGEGSLETPTPTTATPSMCLDKDMSPLLAKRKSKKSSTWTAKSLHQTLKPCVRSMSEKECTIKKLDIIPQLASQRRELPDVCKHLDTGHDNNGFENEVNSAKIKPISKEDTRMSNLLSDHEKESSKDFNKNIENVYNESNIAPLPCETCVHPSVNVDNAVYNTSATNTCTTCVQETESNNQTVENKKELNKQLCRSFRNDLSRKIKKSNVPRRYSDGVKFNLQLARDTSIEVPVNITESSIFNNDYPSQVTTKQEISNNLYGNSNNFSIDQNVHYCNTSDSSKIQNNWMNEPFVPDQCSNWQTFDTRNLSVNSNDPNLKPSFSSSTSYYQNLHTQEISKDSQSQSVDERKIQNDSEIHTVNTSILPNNSDQKYNLLLDDNYHRNCETCILSNDSDTNCNNNPCYSIHIHPNYILPVQRETSKVLNTGTDCLIPRGSTGANFTDINRRSSVPNSPMIDRPLKERKRLPRRVSAPHLLHAVLEVKYRENSMEQERANPTPVPPVRRKRKRKTNRTYQD